jgi:hypothetical protein
VSGRRDVKDSQNISDQHVAERGKDKQAVTWEPRRFPDAPPPAGSVMGPDQHKGEGGHDKAEN